MQTHIHKVSSQTEDEVSGPLVGLAHIHIHIHIQTHNPPERQHPLQTVENNVIIGFLRGGGWGIWLNIIHHHHLLHLYPPPGVAFWSARAPQKI